MKNLTDTFHKLDLINIMRSEYTCFSSTYKTFTNTHYILGHQQKLNKLKRLEIHKVHIQKDIKIK